MRKLIIMLLLACCVLGDAQAKQVRVGTRSGAVYIGELKEMKSFVHVIVVVDGKDVLIPFDQMIYIDEVKEGEGIVTPKPIVKDPQVVAETKPKAEPKQERKVEAKPIEKKLEATPDPKPETNSVVKKVEAVPEVKPEAKPEPKSVVKKVEAVPEVKPEAKPAVVIVEPKPEIKPAVVKVEPKPEVKDVAKVESKPEPKPVAKKVEKTPEPKPEVKPAAPKVEPKPELNDYKGLLLADGNKVYLNCKCDAALVEYDKAALDVLKRQLRRDGYWVVVDNPSEAHFFINYTASSEGGGKILFSISSLLTGNEEFLGSAKVPEDVDENRKVVWELYNKYIIPLHKKIEKGSISKRTKTYFTVE